jgi:hypothetical protein
MKPGPKEERGAADSSRAPILASFSPLWNHPTYGKPKIIEIADLALDFAKSTLVKFDFYACFHQSRADRPILQPLPRGKGSKNG